MTVKIKLRFSLASRYSTFFFSMFFRCLLSNSTVTTNSFYDIYQVGKKEKVSRVRCRQCKISVKIFLLLILLHHLIECELLITKNNFLPYTNIFFRSTNTKNSKDIRFFKKHIFSKTCHIFCFLLFLCF